jgi:nickel-dependent lactate racemase
MEESLKIFYDDYGNSVDVPSAIPLKRVTRLEPRPIRTSSIVDELLQDAFAHPIGSDNIEKTGARNAAVIFSDHTRLPSPYVRNLVSMLMKKADDVKLIVACGSHTPPSEDYLKKTVDDELLRNCRVTFSSPKDSSCRFESIGQTTRGTPVEINEEILDRDLILSSLCVRPHYFAGFEGGAKAILPGCSSLKAISRNHSYVIGNPYARELRIDDNPVRDDMNEVPGMLKRRGIRFRIADFVADSENHAFKIGYGDPVKAHKKLSEVSREIYTVKGLATAVSITVADGSLGRTLYQSTKAFSLTSNIMKRSRNPKSTVILLASLREGIGSSTWANEIVHYASMPSEEIIKDLELRAKKGEFNETLQKVNRFAIDCETLDLRVVSHEAPKEVERLLNEARIFFARELDEAVEDLKFNENIVLVPKGSSTVPIRID